MQRLVTWRRIVERKAISRIKFQKKEPQNEELGEILIVGLKSTAESELWVTVLWQILEGSRREAGKDLGSLACLKADEKKLA
ncbi:hypothetical protein Tco_0242443 [Tanacetum coccineum]